MANLKTSDIPSSTSTGSVIGADLVKDMLNGQISPDVSPNTFPRFPGENEAFDHGGFLDFLDSDLGKDILREMAQSDEQYLFV